MMNCMGQGGAATLVGGIRIADWALAITYLLIGLLAIIAVVAVIRTVAALIRGFTDVWRRRSRSRRSVQIVTPTRPSAGEVP